MKAPARLGAAVALTAAALLVLAAPATGNPPPPADLGVEGGEETWSPKRTFRVVWRNPAPSAGAPVAAVHYRLRDPAGEVAIGATRIGWAATSIEGLTVPGPPGAYTAEVWLEDTTGATGAPAAAKLRFDDQRPGAVVPSAGATWIGRASFPLAIRLSHPSGEPPVSGIRGYAVSVAPTPDRSPCAAADRCTEAETDLHAGVDDDSYLVADLPEGNSYVQAVAVSGSGMASEAVGRAVLGVDKTSPVTKLAGVPAGWTNQPVKLTAVAVDGGSGMLPSVGGVPPYTAIAIDGATPVTASGASVAATVIGDGVHQVAYYARDLAGNVDDGGSSNGRANPPPPSALVRIDRGPPSLSFANAQDPMDPELIRVWVADSMSGPAPGRGWIGIRRSGSGDPFAPLPAAPSPGGELRARWDSDAYAAGEYELRAIGYDAAGNATATTKRANGATMVLSNPLKAMTSLQAGFGVSRPGDRSGVGAQRRTVPFGRGAILGGRLAIGANAPLPGALVRIVERFAADTGLPARVSTVTSGPGGELPPPAAARSEPGGHCILRRHADAGPLRQPELPTRCAQRGAARRLLEGGEDRRTAVGLPRTGRCGAGDDSGRRQVGSAAVPPAGPAVERVPHGPNGPPRPLLLRLPLQRRRQPRHQLPVPRLRTRARRLALRAGRLTATHRARALKLRLKEDGF